MLHRQGLARRCSLYLLYSYESAGTDTARPAGRLDTQGRGGGCYPHIPAAKCALERAGFTCDACTTLGHFRLQRFLIAAQQVRATAPEAGRLSLAVVVTDDAGVERAARDAVWLASHPSWSIVVLALAKTSGDAGNANAGAADANAGSDTRATVGGQLLSALLLLRHARHLVGSPSSSLFQLGVELAAGLEYAAAASSRSSKRGGGARSGGTEREGAVCAVGGAPETRMWSVDVPMSAGAFGLVGANIRPSATCAASANVSGVSARACSLHLDRDPKILDELSEEEYKEEDGVSARTDSPEEAGVNREATLALLKTRAADCDGDRCSVYLLYEHKGTNTDSKND